GAAGEADVGGGAAYQLGNVHRVGLAERRAGDRVEDRLGEVGAVILQRHLERVAAAQIDARHGDGRTAGRLPGRCASREQTGRGGVGAAGVEVELDGDAVGDAGVALAAAGLAERRRPVGLDDEVHAVGGTGGGADVLQGERGHEARVAHLVRVPDRGRLVAPAVGELHHGRVAGEDVDRGRGVVAVGGEVGVVDKVGVR